MPQSVDNLTLSRSSGYNMFLTIVRLSLVTTSCLALSSSNLETRQNIDLSVPFYGTSANGFTSSLRGWNSFGLQSLRGSQSFTLNQINVQAQCDLLNTTAGYTLCSIDSGWSGNGGDSNGLIVPDTTLFPNLNSLANHLHSQGKLLGIYILPGAFSSDAGATVKGTKIKLGTLFDVTQPSYNLRQTFDFSKNGVQEWHNSVVNNFAAM